MITDHSQKTLLVSVIIPCYNHGLYLANAIESVLSQNGVSTEIIVVDDGSTDNTKAVCSRYKSVRYVYQQNQGLSAARNTGITCCHGEFLVFLDADDWFLPKAIETNLSLLSKNKEVAFISGAHAKFLADKNIIEEKKVYITENHYEHFLRGNYIAMHATVMYQRWVFEHFKFDTSLKALEDYDMYLNIARKFPVLHHQTLIAVYRIHDSNMSGNFVLMMNSALSALRKQENQLKNEREKNSFSFGLQYWKAYYTGGLYRTLSSQSWPHIKARKAELQFLKTHNRMLYSKLLLKKILHVV